MRAVKVDTTAFVEFLSRYGGSPFSAVLGVTNMLSERGFGESNRTSGYVVKHSSSVMGWKLPKAGTIKKIVVLAAHTDSPCLRTRPNCRRVMEGYEQLGVSTYGGGLWHTWFDRGLAVDGQVVYKDADGSVRNMWIGIKEPICIIPSLCIHLQERSPPPFDYSKEDHLQPIMGLVNSCDNAETQVPVKTETQMPAGLREKIIMQIPQGSKLLTWDLCLYDCNPPRLCGISEEFIEAGGLDNKSSLFCVFKALCEVEESSSGTAYFAVGFDHEEVGSGSAMGALSPLITEELNRVLRNWSSDKDGRMVIENWKDESVIISCDAAHAVHPNYASVHQKEHKPKMNGGVVLKVNQNQRYATTAMGLAKIKDMSDAYNLPIQEYVVKNGTPCGSTIGPLLARLTGIETIDCGMPILAMHSIRELCGVLDVEHLINFSKGCYTYL